jgi:sigma-B regulation protein RsbU (phosphoserine phosphatase)
METTQLITETEAFAGRDVSTGRFGQNDMREAHCIQASLLPTGAMQDESFEIAFRYIPFSEVGGDFADFFRLPDGLIGIYLGDVVGKGLPAAMYGSLVMGAFRGIRKTGAHTADVLALLNGTLMQRPLEGRFCSTLYALFNPATRELTFSNAGLPMPLLASENECRPLGEGGLPSGLFPVANYGQHTVLLSPGDSVLCATDGLHESCNYEGAEFCSDQMARTWAQCRCKSAEASLDYLLNRFHAFSEDGGRLDDVTAVVLTIPLHERAQLSRQSLKPGYGALGASVGMLNAAAT